MRKWKREKGEEKVVKIDLSRQDLYINEERREGWKDVMQYACKHD